MTTESEVTLPDALAWLKSLSGDYAAKIAAFISSNDEKLITEKANSYAKGYSDGMDCRLVGCGIPLIIAANEYEKKLRANKAGEQWIQPIIK